MSNHAASTHSIEFPLRLGWASDYSSLFNAAFDETTSANDLLSRALDRGRTIISAKGGSGKTTVAKRLRQAAESAEVTTLFVDMKRWSPILQDTWESLGSDPMARAEFLLSRLGTTEMSLAEIDALPASYSKLVIIDGLNEVRSTVGQDIVLSANRLVETYMNLSILLTDRLVRRSIDMTRWRLSTILPLEAHVVRDVFIRTIGTHSWEVATPPQRLMLESPFFLDKTLEDGRLTSNSSEAIEIYLLEHSGLSGDLIDAAARGAYAAYRAERGGRTFPLEIFESNAAPGLVQSLASAGILVVHGRDAYFQHHLFHDFLAARHLAVHLEEWCQSTFDAISFGASSFDAVSKVLEQLGPEIADDFLRKIYDWNPYAAAYAIGDVEAPESVRVSSEMKLVIAAMLAERLWDIIEATVQRSMDALGVLGTNEARVFVRAASIAEVIACVERWQSQEQWFLDWQALFTRAPGGPGSLKDLEQLSSPDPIMGWTAANVLRRSELNDVELEGIRERSWNVAASAVRWRGVHVLGAFPTKENETALFERFESDSDEWVRYGALRSLMEMAARSQELRSEILAGIVARVEILEERPKLQDEFSRAALASVSGEQAQWAAGVGQVLRALLEFSRDAQEVERWARLGQELESRHAA